MAECGDGGQQQWEAVQGPMTDSGLGSSMRRRLYRGPWQIRGWQQYGRPVICQHPMSKN
ncbi:unnamed protein product [Staurois parvus]|uniref:Uncharacterized protein n=1 Tax=Staurois parvus TaxID=386267 RepID=A0ABN9AY04_9NEOB|nr:unnamed protein product [Staurois parvus]